MIICKENRECEVSMHALHNNQILYVARLMTVLQGWVIITNAVWDQHHWQIEEAFTLYISHCLTSKISHALSFSFFSLLNICMLSWQPQQWYGDCQGNGLIENLWFPNRLLNLKWWLYDFGEAKRDARRWSSWNEFTVIIREPVTASHATRHPKH